MPRFRQDWFLRTEKHDDLSEAAALGSTIKSKVMRHGF